MQTSLADAYEQLQTTRIVLPPGCEIDVAAFGEVGSIVEIRNDWGFSPFELLPVHVTPYHVGGCI